MLSVPINGHPIKAAQKRPLFFRRVAIHSDLSEIGIDYELSEIGDITPVVVSSKGDI